MKTDTHLSRWFRSTRRLAKAAGLSLGLAMVAIGQADPAKITSHPSDLSAEEGTSTRLSAEVSGSPNTYRWHRANGGGGALAFAGDSQYVSVPIDVPETEYTVEFWFRTDDPNAGLFCAVDANLGGGGHDRHIHLADGNIRIRTWSDPGVEVSAGLNLADGKWHHIAHVISVELGGQFVYVDGEPVIEGVKDMSNFDWQKHVNIGFSNDAGSPHLVGEMDELRIWDYAFEQEEIQARMNKPLSGDEEWLLAYYNFDETEGDTLADSSGNEYEGALMNFAESGWGASAARLGVESAMNDGGGISGTDSAELKFARLAQADADTYFLRVSNPDGGVDSDKARLTVTVETVPPALVSHGALVTEDEFTEVAVQFDEALNPDAAEEVGNYSIAGATVVDAILQESGDGVLLDVEGLDTGDYQLTVSGLTDLAGNKMAPSKTGGGFISLQPLNIGDIDPTGVAHNFGGEIEVISGGADIWSNADDFTFLFEEKTGDFDMAVQVRSISNPNGWARNGLMVRESLDDISKMLGAFATPPHGQGYFALDRREESAQCFWWNNDGTPGSAVKQGGIKYGNDTVPGLPDIWIRLKRSGNRFTAFRSGNGEDWIELGVNTLEFSDTVYFGICQSSPGATRYANYGPFVYTGTEIAITEPPQTATATLGWEHTFRVGYKATTAGKPLAEGELSFQWLKNGQAIAGANGPAYTTPGVLSADDDGSRYSVTVSLGDVAATSSEAVLSVAKDSTAPVVASAKATKPAGVSGGGAALGFKGGGQYVSVPIDVPETDYTVEFWFRTEDPNAGLYCVVDANLGGGGHDRHLHLTGGNIRVRTWSGPGVEVSTGLNLADGEWHHLAHTLGAAANGQQIFIDGELVVQGGKDMSNFDWQKHVNIGFSNDAASQYLVGEMDELRIWGTVRTGEEINASRNKPLSGDEDDLIAYYNFDQTEGDTLADLSGNGHDGALMGMGDRNWAMSAAPLGQAPIDGIQLPTTIDITFDDIIRDPNVGSGGSLIFDGRSASVALPDDIPQIFSDGGAITVEYWFKGESFQSAVRWQDGQYFVAGWNGLHIISTDGGTGAGIAVGPATDGKWHHVAMTWEVDMADGFKSYLDGELVAQRDSGPELLPLINGQAYLGAYQGVSEFTKGQLDEVRIWETVRTGEQLKEWMNKPLGDNSDGLLAYYQFDELSGGTLPDASGNEFDGTLKNMTDANWATGAGAAFTALGPKGQRVPGTFGIDGAAVESVEYLGDGRTVRIVAYGIESPEAKATVNGIRDAGDNEIAADTQVVIGVEQEGGPVEPPVVSLHSTDGTLSIDTTRGTLQSAPSVNGPWEDVTAPLLLNLNELDAAGFFRAVVE
ncbi:MAG: hypothetical protein H8E20_05210 [Verrucomicrobia bacterium]|nr:hypothetical protein [Verrucomicrobiota bacterium]